MEDMISRKALCEYALNQKDKSITPNDIMRFPSAQPETHEKRTETHSCDCIERQAAIEALKEAFNPSITNFVKAKMAIDNLPPAQPEPCEDSVSRKAAIDVCDKAIDLWHGQLGEGIVIAVKKKIEELPPAQPDLVRCNECEYGAQDEVGRWFCRSLGCQIGNEDGSGYCADAERRTND